MGPDKVLA